MTEKMRHRIALALSAISMFLPAYLQAQTAELQEGLARLYATAEQHNATLRSLETALRKFKENSARLTDSDQSIVSAAWKAVNHGINQPTGRELPPLGNCRKENNKTMQ